MIFFSFLIRKLCWCTLNSLLKWTRYIFSGEEQDILWGATSVWNFVLEGTWTIVLTDKLGFSFLFTNIEIFWVVKIGQFFFLSGREARFSLGIWLISSVKTPKIICEEILVSPVFWFKQPLIQYFGWPLCIPGTMEYSLDLLTLVFLTWSNTECYEDNLSLNKW